MKGQLTVRFLTTITVVLATLFTVLVTNKIAVLGSREDMVATDLETLYQLVRVADKYNGETLAYAYFLELNKEFSAAQYSNQPDEKWNVPSWFVYPSTSPATCESVDGKMGCVIWNLDGGTDDKHPCPSVVSYTPTPPVNQGTVFGSININNIKNNQANAFSEANQMLANGTTTGGTVYGLSLFGKGVSIEPNITLTPNVAKTDVNATGTITVRLTDNVGVWNTELNRDVETHAHLIATLNTRTKNAYCVCRKAGTTNPEVLARYVVTEYYVNIKVINEKTGETVVDGNVPYIKYFSGTDYQTVYDGVTTYENCELIVP